MDYVIVAVAIIGFIWLVYAVRKSVKKKASGMEGLPAGIFFKLTDDPRFESDPKFRENVLKVINSLGQNHQSQASLKKSEEDFLKWTEYSSWDESDEAFWNRLKFQRKRLETKRESKKGK
jgi:hypothetical protein